MSKRPGNRYAARAALLALAAAMLAGCGPSVPKSIAADTKVRVALGGAGCPLAGRVTASSACVALEHGGRLATTLWGSSSCPPVPIQLLVLSPHHVRVVTSDDYGTAICTTDLAPVTSVIRLNEGRVDVKHALVVEMRSPSGNTRTLVAAAPVP